MRSGDETRSAARVGKKCSALVSSAALLAAVEGDDGDLRLRLQEAANWLWPKLPIGGLDLIEVGVKPGPHIGALLSVVEDWWMKHDFTPDRDACLAAIKKSLETRA